MNDIAREYLGNDQDRKKAFRITVTVTLKTKEAA